MVRGGTSRVVADVGPTTNRGSKRKGRGKSVNGVLEKLLEYNKNQPIEIIFRSDLMKPVDGFEKEWITEVGILTRTHAPHQYARWNDIPDSRRQLIYDKIAEKFILNFDDPHVKEIVEQQVKICLRMYRHKMKNHFDKYPTEEEARRHPYDRVEQEDWDIICNRIMSNTFKRMSKINKANRAKNKITHCGGSKSFVRRREELQRKRSREVTRIELFEETHRSQKGWTTQEAQKLHEEMTRKYSQASQIVEDPTSIDIDSIADSVLNKNKSGYQRGLGYGVKPTSTSGRCSRMELDDACRRAEAAEQRAEVAEHRAEAAESKAEAAEILASEAVKKVKQMEQSMDERMNKMLDFMSQFQIPNRMEQASWE